MELGMAASKPPARKGSRLSGATKREIRSLKQSGSLSGKQAQALRKALRSPSVSKSEVRILNKAGVKAGGKAATVFNQQVQRSQRRSAALKPVGGGRQAGAKPVTSAPRKPTNANPRGIGMGVGTGGRMNPRQVTTAKKAGTTTRTRGY